MFLINNVMKKHINTESAVFLYGWCLESFSLVSDCYSSISTKIGTGSHSTPEALCWIYINNSKSGTSAALSALVSSGPAAVDVSWKTVRPWLSAPLWRTQPGRSLTSLDVFIPASRPDILISPSRTEQAVAFEQVKVMEVCDAVMSTVAQLPSRQKGPM